MYIKVNAQYNAIGIPFKKRLSLYLKEIKYLSLLLHDTLPSNYSKQGIAPGDISISSHQTFFSPKDSITIVRKKWDKTTIIFGMFIPMKLILIHYQTMILLNWMIY